MECIWPSALRNFTTRGYHFQNPTNLEYVQILMKEFEEMKMAIELKAKELSELKRSNAHKRKKKENGGRSFLISKPTFQRSI